MIRFIVRIAFRVGFRLLCMAVVFLFMGVFRKLFLIARVALRAARHA